METKIKHLEFIQSVINRRASDSFRVKAGPWSSSPPCSSSRRGKTGSIPRPSASSRCSSCWGFDDYFLGQKRLYRAPYDQVRSMDTATVDFSMDVSKFRTDGE